MKELLDFLVSFVPIWLTKNIGAATAQPYSYPPMDNSRKYPRSPSEDIFAPRRRRRDNLFLIIVSGYTEGGRGLTSYISWKDPLNYWTL
jgi:hypothetical protein